MRDITDPDRVFLEFKRGSAYVQKPVVVRKDYRRFILEPRVSSAMSVRTTGAWSFELWDAETRRVESVYVSPSRSREAYTHNWGRPDKPDDMWIRQVIDTVFPGVPTADDMRWYFDDAIRRTFPAEWPTAAAMTMRDMVSSGPPHVHDSMFGGYYSLLIINLVQLLNE